MSAAKTHIYANPEATAARFGDYLIAQARNQPNFHCALSGGSTPRLLFEYLAKTYQSTDDWKNIHFYWGDERCVPPTDPESNFGMTKKHLFNHVPMTERQIHRVLGEKDAGQEAQRYGDMIKQQLPLQDGIPVFDLIILGLGNDGHTASIFPHQMELLKSNHICDVATHPESGQKRITLTGQVINQAKEVAFLVTGVSKAEKVEEILHSSGGWESYPASFIQPSGQLSWYLDEQAAHKIN